MTVSSQAASKKTTPNGLAAAEGEGAAGDVCQCRCCGTELVGAFCHGCGQNAKVQELSLSVLLREGVSQVLNLNNAYLRTFAGMVCRPGSLISEYVAGKRKPYTNPLKFFLFTLSLTLLLRWAAAELGLWESYQDILPDQPKVQYMANNAWLPYSLMQPPMAGALTLLFWRTRRNLAENVAFSLLVVGLGYFYVAIIEATLFNTIGSGTVYESYLIHGAFFVFLSCTGSIFYKQRLLYVIPKMVLVYFASLFSAGYAALWIISVLSLHLP